MSDFTKIVGVLNGLLHAYKIDQTLYNQAVGAARDIQHAWDQKYPPGFDEFFGEETVETMHEKIRELQQKLHPMEKDASHAAIMHRINELFPHANALQTVASMCRHYGHLRMQTEIKRQQQKQISGLQILCPTSQEMEDRLRDKEDRKGSLDFSNLGDEEMCITECNHPFGTDYMIDWCASCVDRKLKCTCPGCREPIDKVYSLSACPANAAATAAAAVATDQQMHSNAVLFDMMFLRAYVLALEGMMVTGKYGGSRKTTKRNKKHKKHKVRKARKSRKSRKSCRKH